MENNFKVDHTINGKCSGCGACCQAILSISDKEVQKIKSYIGQKKIQPINRHTEHSYKFIDVCPFLNKENRCNIYPVRPAVCKRFICSQFTNPNAPYFDHSDKHFRNMYDIFLKDEYYPKPDIDLEEQNRKYDALKTTYAKNKFFRKG